MVERSGMPTEPVLPREGMPARALATEPSDAAESDPICACSAAMSSNVMEGSMDSRLLAVGATPSSARGARCLGISVMGARLAAETPMEGSVMGRGAA